MPTSLRTSVEGLFDDAGLFPPARRPMAEALTVHQRVRTGPHGRLVGPFLCPVDRLDELDGVVASGFPRPERLGLVVPATAAAAGGDAGGPQERAAVRPDVVQVEGPLGVDLPGGPMDRRRFLELPADGDVTTAVEAVAGQGAGAKIRCGGAEPTMVPSSERLAEVLLACAARGVPLKATAGLHQPFRHLDAEGGGLQHGFLNLLAAASVAVDAAADAADRSHGQDGRDGRERLVAILEVTAAGDTAAVVEQVGARSRELVRSIGTCSLDEPIGELDDLGLLG